MVKVCDSIMGSGKSSAAITYMNEHPEKRFIYITPYCDEAKRIAAACKNMEFREPKRVKGSKTYHTMLLVEKNKNVATTHQAFRFYPKELIDAIREKHYTLIIDEDVETLEELKDSPDDIKMVFDAGYMEETSKGVYHLVYDNYHGKAHRDFFRIARSRDIILEKNQAYYWQMPSDLLAAFDDVFILTYLFEAQSLYCALTINDIPYHYIGVRKDTDGTYRFCDEPGQMPEYVSRLPEMIHILTDDRINDIGDDYYALSSSWFDKEDSDVEQLKNNVYNYFRRRVRAPAKKRMWSTYKKAKSKVKGKGYTKAFVSCNSKAMNKFRDRIALAYCTNVFVHVGKKLFYSARGIKLDDDKYALSVMLQWIWRSAIRDGEEIWIYVPSSRMRKLLTDWIESVTQTQAA